MECKLSGTWYRFSSVYFPNGNLNRDIIETFFLKNPNTFFGCDTNSRHPFFGDISANLYGNILFNLTNTTGLRIFNSNTPTCMKSNYGSFIDKFLSNSNISPSTIVTSIPSFSDHFGIVCKIPLNVPDTSTNHTRLKLFNRANIPAMNSHILRKLKQLMIPHDRNVSSEECESIAINLNMIFKTAVDKYVPTTQHTQHRVLLSSTTRALQHKSKELQRKIFSLGPLPPERLVKTLRIQTNLLKKMILNNVRHETGKFFQNTFDSIESIRDAYRIIRSFTGHKKSATISGALFTDSDKTSSIAGSLNIANSTCGKFCKKSSAHY